METGTLTKTAKLQPGLLVVNAFRAIGPVIVKSLPLLAVNALVFIVFIAVSFLFPPGPGSPGGRLIADVVIISVSLGILLYYLYKAVVKPDKMSLYMAIIQAAVWLSAFLLWQLFLYLK